ncbi:MAG: hypothetical protein HeimC3_02510 [Candidatus Heimdallarchaeota archaeon LC_3]|nr:MAG: hypothetical protein HeimC3_02510 [Candidatus Heimdallarchaeota archaeon LC_3]
MTTYNLTCPECNRASTFISLFKDATDHGHNVVIGGQQITADMILHQYVFDKKGFYHDLGKCMSCGVIKHIYCHSNRDGEILDFPFVDPERIHSSIPEAVRKDIAESQTAFNAKLPNASALMARRALQRICLNKNIQRNKLFNQINTLLENNPELRELAQEIREFGNLAAHPGATITNDVNLEESGLILEFLNHLVRILYIIPYEINQSREKRLDRD